MNTKKIIDGVYSDVSDEVTQNCATCKWAIPFTTVDYVICSKKKLVKADYVCKKYEYNRLLKHPKKRRNLTGKHFTAEDFSID
jgi:hypothetical protein